MDRRGERLRKRLIRGLLPALRVVPPRLASRLVARIGRVEHDLSPGLRDRCDSAVARGRAYFGPGPWDAPGLSRSLAGSLASWRARDVLLDGLSDARLADLFAIEGREHFEAAHAEGRGVVLLGNHYASHMLPAHWLVRQGVPLRLFMERPRSISKALARQFDDTGPLGQDKLFISRRATPNEAAVAILRAARVLKAGLALNIAGDVRWIGPHTAPARFLGRTYTFSSTWVVLAAISGAPVVPAYGSIAPDGTHRVEFTAPLRVPPSARTADASPWVQSVLDALEDRVRRDPIHSNDYFFWHETDAYLHRPDAQAG